MNMIKYEQNLILIMQMHYQEIKKNFKNLRSMKVHHTYKLSNLQSIYKKKVELCRLKLTSNIQ